MATGTPKQVAKVKGSHTGVALKAFFAEHAPEEEASAYQRERPRHERTRVVVRVVLNDRTPGIAITWWLFRSVDIVEQLAAHGGSIFLAASTCLDPDHAPQSPCTGPAMEAVVGR